MFSLVGLLASVGLTIAFYVWRRPVFRRARGEALSFTCLYCLSLGLALRFGGRTYPGIYFPDSPFLNSLLNGNSIFTGIGYLAVVLAWIADVMLILFLSSVRSFEPALRAVRWLAVSVAVLISIYGFAWAVIMQRLP